MGIPEDDTHHQHIATVAPSRYSDVYFSALHKKIENLVTSLGIRFGPLFFQGIVSDDNIYLYDPGFRLPGSDFDLLIKDATGFDPIKTAIVFAMTGNDKARIGHPAQAWQLGGRIGTIFSLVVGSGQITAFQGIDKLEQDSRIKRISYRHQIGDQITAQGDASQRVLEIGALLDTKDDLGDMCELLQHVCVLDKCGNDMTLSRPLFNGDSIEIHAQPERA